MTLDIGSSVTRAPRVGSRPSAVGQLSPHRREVFCEGLFLVLKLSPHMGAQTWVLRHQARYITRSDGVQVTCRVRGPGWHWRAIDPLTSLVASRPRRACAAPPTHPPPPHYHIAQQLYTTTFLLKPPNSCVT